MCAQLSANCGSTTEYARILMEGWTSSMPVPSSGEALSCVEKVFDSWLERHMEVAREVKIVRASLLNVKAAIESIRDAPFGYLTRELDEQVASLNTIEEWLNNPNACKEDLEKSLASDQKDVFTLVLDNREDACSMCIAPREQKKTEHAALSRSMSNSSITEEYDRSVPALIADPLQTLSP